MTTNLNLEIPLAWLIALGLFFFYALSHIACFHFFKISNRYRFIARSYLIFLPGVAFCAWLGAREVHSTILLSKPILQELHALGFLFFFYLLSLTFFSGTDHSIRVRIAVELHKAEKSKDGRLSHKELLARYQPEALGARRVGKIVAKGFAVEQNNRVSLTRKGRLMGLTLLTLKRILNTLEQS